MSKEKKVIFSEEKCKGCQLCTTVCPVKIISMSERINSHGYHPAEVKDQEACLACGQCAIICPDVVIKVMKPE